MPYIPPNIIVINAQKLSSYIQVLAKSDDTCGLGCPDTSGYFSNTNPCSGNYNFETCEPDPINYDTRLNR
jgi:hypothetical protein